MSWVAVVHPSNDYKRSILRASHFAGWERVTVSVQLGLLIAVLPDRGVMHPQLASKTKAVSKGEGAEKAIATMSAICPTGRR